MRLDVPCRGSSRNHLVVVLVPVDPCNWEPGRGVPGCRSGLRPSVLWFVVFC